MKPLFYDASFHSFSIFFQYFIHIEIIEIFVNINELIIYYYHDI